MEARTFNCDLPYQESWGGEGIGSQRGRYPAGDGQGRVWRESKERFRAKTGQSHEVISMLFDQDPLHFLGLARVDDAFQIMIGTTIHTLLSNMHI